MLATGIAELPNGLAEARESMERIGEALTVDMEKKISMLAVLGTLGPMIGLLGTLKGMIASFSVIARSDQVLKASEVAGGISEALLLTFEGVALSVPAIYFFAIFRNRVSTLLGRRRCWSATNSCGISPMRPAAKRRPRRRRRGSSQASQSLVDGLVNSEELRAMSGSVSNEANAEPNLTPMLDMVFQLITFFMLVMNFKAASMDLSLKLPVVGSAKMVDTKGTVDLLVLNVDARRTVARLWPGKEGHPAILADRGHDQLAGGAAQESRAEIGRRAAFDRGDSRRQGDPVPPAQPRDHHLPGIGFRNFALKAMNKAEGG